MAERPWIGLNLQPDQGFLRRTRRIAEEMVDFFELCPELCWGPGPAATEAREFFLQVKERSGLPFAAHGLSFSLGSGQDQDRQERWLKQLREDHERFQFEWFSEHLGFVEQDGLFATLPLPLPDTTESRDVVAANLRRLQTVVPAVAFENWAGLFALHPAEQDPAFFRALCQASGAWLLLDLHNVWTHCKNLNADPDAYVDALDLTRVLAIHISGGSDSDPTWLPSRRVLRLDSHDGPVPKWVWQTLERILPDCTSLRGIVLERLADGLDDHQVREFELEFKKLRAMVC